MLLEVNMVHSSGMGCNYIFNTKNMYNKFLFLMSKSDNYSDGLPLLSCIRKWTCIYLIFIKEQRILVKDSILRLLFFWSVQDFSHMMLLFWYAY